MLGKTRKIEPIDLFRELIHGRIVSITAGDIKFTRNKDKSVHLTERAARELAIEAFAYKEFYDSAMALARLIDGKAAGVYVAGDELAMAKDLYVMAKNQCAKLHLNLSNQDVIREGDYDRVNRN